MARVRGNVLLIIVLYAWTININEITRERSS